MAEASRERGERLQIMLNPDELRVIDDFRFSKRMPSRAAALRELLKRGLAAEGFSLAAAGLKSAAYGVIDGPAKGRRSSALDRERVEEPTRLSQRSGGPPGGR